MTKLFKNSKSVLSIALAFAVLAVSLFTGVVINTEAACASSEGTTIYWDGTTVTEPTQTDADGNTLITSAAELAYITSNTVTGNYKVADGIDAIVLQGDTYAEGIMALADYAATQAYFEDTTNITPAVWKNEGTFQGTFDGNGVTIYGMYSTGDKGGLFGTVYESTVIKNVSVKNSYIDAAESAGALASCYAASSAYLSKEVTSTSETNPGTWTFGELINLGSNRPGDYWTLVADYATGMLTLDKCVVSGCYINSDAANSTYSSTGAGVWVGVGYACLNLTASNMLVHSNKALANNIEQGITGLLSTKHTIPTANNPLNNTDIKNCIILDCVPYTVYNDAEKNNQAYMHQDFTNVYTNTEITFNPCTNSKIENYNGVFNVIDADDLIGATDKAKELVGKFNTASSETAWMINPNGYPELRVAHKGATLTDNHDGTHSLACGCGVYSGLAEHNFVDGVCECGALLNCAARKTIYWDGTVATGFSSTGSGDSAEDPIIINTAAELAYLVRDASVRSGSTVTVADKYYKIADGIGAIVLQPQAYVDEIMALDSAAAVKDYFSDTSKTFIEWAGNEGWEQGSFAGTFDGNGVTIYGMYGNNPNMGNNGLFSTVDAGATFKNFTIKNAYLHTSKANFNIGAIACVSSESNYDKGFGVVWVDRCAVVNSYIRNEFESSFRSGIMIGNLQNSEAAYFDNCFVYGNDATYGPDNTPMAILGSAKNSINPNDAINIPEGLETVVASDNLYRSMVRNSIIIGATPYISAKDSYRVNDKDSFVNVYTDAETQDVVRGDSSTVTYEENQIKKLSAIDGATIAAEAENLDWNSVWFAADMPAFRDAHDDVLSAVPYAEDNYAGHVEACSCGLASSVVEHDYDENYYCATCEFTCDHRSNDHITMTPIEGDCLTATTVMGVCDCGFSRTAPAEAPGHDFTYNQEAPSADCQTNGTAAYNYCPNCDKKYAADADNFEPFENAIDDADLVLDPAACSPLADLAWDENNHWQVCDTCGEIIEGTVTSHTGAWEADLVDPASGHTGACADEACGYVANDVVPHGFGDDNVCDQCFWACENHNFVPDEENGVIAEGDCTTDRVVATYCTICGVQGDNDVTTAPGHNPGDVQIENEIHADCVTDGSHDEVTYCTECGEEVNRTNVPDLKKGHELGVYEGHAPTCVWTGENAHVWCHVCDKYFAADHDLEDIYSEAYIDYDTEVSIAADPDAHDWVDVEATDATCDEAGNIAYTYCKYCDTVVIGDEEYVAEIDYDKFNEEYDAIWQEEWEKFIAENEEPGEDATEEEFNEFISAWSAIIAPIYESMYKQALIDALAEEVEIAVEALGHNLKEVAEVAATTEKEGTKAHWVCEECDKLYADKDGKTEVTAEELVIAKLAKVEDNKTENTDTNTESPKTGETVATVVAAVAAIVAAGYVLVRKARKA